MNRLKALIATTAIVSSGFGAATMARAATAADAGPGQVAEVIVTAEKREQRVQDVPIAVTAFNAATIKNATVLNLTDLSGKIPNVTLDAVATFPNASSFAIRGLGFGDVESTFEPTVGVEVNGVYLARNVGATQDLFDISSIEVLRGPQGTLHGANTIGGVVSIATKKPTGKFDGEIQVTAGDRGRAEVRAAIDAPIIKDVLTARLSVLDLNYDGYLHNTYNDKSMGSIHDLSERLTLQFTPNSRFDATLIADYDKAHDGGFPNQNGTPALGAIAPAPDFLLAEAGYAANPNQKPYDVISSIPLPYNFSTTGVSLQMNYKFDFGTLTSITGYREYDDYTVNEYGGAGPISFFGSSPPEPFFTSARTQNHDQISQEVRLASPTGSRIDYVVGVYYMHQHYGLQNAEAGALFGLYPAIPQTTQYASQGEDSVAGFGQVDFHVNDQLTLTAGGRYSYESKDFHNTPPGYFPTQFNYLGSWSDFSPKFEASYKITRDNLVYAQYSRGFRSGGFNGRAGSESSAGPYKTEHVDSYEIGSKNAFFDRRLVVNADIFIEKYANIQEDIQRLNPDTHLDETVVANAGSATYQGVEVEAHGVLGHGFTMDASVGYLDAHFDKFTANLNGDCAGPASFFCGTNDYKNVPLPSVPRWTIGLSGTYRRELPFAIFTGNINGTYQSDQYTSLTPINVVAPWFTLRKANAIGNATVTLATLDEKYAISAWVKNFTDEHVLYSRFTVGPLSAPQSYQPPLTWGISLSGKF